MDDLNDAVGTKETENRTELSLTAFCWWRTDIPQDVCEDYWRDVHGIMFARARGMWQYRQLRLGSNRPDLWPTVKGVSFEVARRAQPQGIGHALFASKGDLVAFGNNPVARESIPSDTGNFIGRIGALLSPPNRAHTFVDRIGDHIAQGPPATPTFVIGLVAEAGAAQAEAFHAYVIEDIAQPWCEHPDVLRLRVEPLPPYDQAMGSPGVPLQWPTDETYLCWVEVAVRNEGVFSDLPAWLSADALAKQVRSIHTYPVRAIYTMISSGRPTEVGLRGYPATRLIEAIGAKNQREEPLLHTLYGDAAGGLNQTRQT